MGSSGCTSEIVESEIVESNEELNNVPLSGSNQLRIKVKAEEKGGKSHDYPVEDDLDQLLKAIDIRTSSRVLGPSSQAGVDLLRKNAHRKPVRIRRSPPAGIGISESVSLKQALRRLCISQASEMAAMKRLSMSTASPGASEAGTIHRLYASLMVQANETNHTHGEEKMNLIEISLVPEKVSTNSSEGSAEFSQQSDFETPDQSTVTSLHSASSNSVNTSKIRIQDVISDESTETIDDQKASVETNKNRKSVRETSDASSQVGAILSKPIASSRLVKPIFRNKGYNKKKMKPETSSLGTVHMVSHKSGFCSNNTKISSSIEPIFPASSCTNPSSVVGEEKTDSGAKKPGDKLTECLRTKEKGECSHSSKSSIGDYSTSTSISDESHSGLSGNSSRPHMSKDVRWITIRHVAMQQGTLGLDNFKLLKRLGCGDIGTVYLAELVGSDCLFALKVMDIEYLISRKKMLRAQTEREILQMLDHPFLPTLYAHFTTDNLSCLVMEYCPGGDLHVLRQRQPGRSFSEPAARFYVAEVLLALEYLHMLGVIYRDLKPENILVREDGHIMLSDFDLSLRCSVSPMLLLQSSENLGTGYQARRLSGGPCAENSCIDPLCLQPSCVQPSCFTPRLASRRPKADQGSQSGRLPQLVAEPTDARSNSFVGTHEYLAPEIIRGDGHGSAVDWWTFGIFLYELLFGKTPFKGPGNEETLANVVSQSLRFPENAAVSTVSNHARDLIRGLLVKDPENRLGSSRGAAEIKQHPFFEGLNWALIRSALPPETRSCDVVVYAPVRKKKEGKCLDFRSTSEDLEFAVF